MSNSVTFYFQIINLQMEQQRIQKSPTHYPKLGLFLIIGFFILVGLIYGFFTSFGQVNNLTHTTTNLQFIFTHVLAVLGFGLLLVYFKFGILQTFVIGLLVCFINILMGPMLQQFWYNVFVKGFFKSDNDQNANFPLNLDAATQHINNITLNFARISTYCSISLLVALTSVIGKIGLINTVITTIVFNVGFNLSYYLNFNIFYKSSPNYQYFIMDDLQGSRVFAFGSGFGLALLLFYNRFVKIERKSNFQYSDNLSCLLTLLGTIFTLAFFYFVLDTYVGGPKVNALLNIYFSFSASIVSSVAISCILKGVVTFHNINMSIISGAIQVSIIATFIKTPYVAMLAGVLGGILTSILSLYLLSRINNKYFRDSKGLIVVYLVNALICSFFVCPIVLKAYENDARAHIYNEGYHMVYTGISLGIGLGFGILAGFLRSCFKEDIDLSDSLFFNEVYHFQEEPKKKAVLHEDVQTMDVFSVGKAQQTTYNEAETGIILRV